MINPFEQILQELNSIKDHLSRIEEKAQPGPTRIPVTDFCKAQGITRPTFYAWADRGLIKTEMIGGRRFVISDSIMVDRKYQRQDNESIKVNIR